VDKEEELTRRDGTKSWLSVSKFPWQDADGEIIGVIGISRDISRRKKLENHILRMLSIATHDMRAPIVSIALTIKLLARGRFGEVSVSVKQTLSDVFNRMIKLEKIVGEYLTKSSVMHSSEIGRKEILDLREDIIDPILGEFLQEIERGKIQIDNRLGGIPGDKIFVSANKNWLGIVYRNLLSNAIRYTPKGGTIAYGFEDEGNMYRLNVFNNGQPIPAEKKKSIFEMFESEASSGIGLPVIRELVRRHGGDLWCEESPGGHPNFVFTLPKE
jgi:signal transduction histidine kinase